MKTKIKPFVKVKITEPTDYVWYPRRKLWSSIQIHSKAKSFRAFDNIIPARKHAIHLANIGFAVQLTSFRPHKGVYYMTTYQFTPN
jgi:hypothetical protein